MADGDMVIRDGVTCKYLGDDGVTYRRTIPSFYQAQGALGWALNDSYTTRTAPRGYKLRCWLVQNAADHTQRARVIVATPTAYIAGVIGTQTVKMDYRGFEVTMTLYGKEGERHRGQREDIAVQASAPA